MAKINLLPWREELREERKKEFLTVLAGVVVIAAGGVYMGHNYVEQQISEQNVRNKLLDTEIKALAKSVSEITELKDKKAQLLARMEVIQNLQGNRPVIVKIFDEMVRTLPEGVFFSDLSMKKEVVSVHGTAESNNRVSSLMRRLDTSDWFTKPNLTSVQANPAYGSQANDFSMTVRIEMPDPEDKKGS